MRIPTMPQIMYTNACGPCGIPPPITWLVRNQDDEFNLRLARSGGKIWQSVNIKSWYHPRESLRHLFAQYAQYGYWKACVLRKHRLPASIRHVVPAIFVLALLVLLVSSI